MKKISLPLYLLTAILLITTFNAKAQVHWTTDKLEVTGFNANLGTTNRRPLHFAMNDTTRVRIDSLGRFQVRNLAGNGVRLLYVDAIGNLLARGGEIDGGDEHICDKDFPDVVHLHEGGLPYQDLLDVACPSRPCLKDAGPWFEGGNKIGDDGNNRVGTCSSHDFILIAGGSERMWINHTSGKVGIGESTPQARLHVKESAALGTALNDVQLLTRIAGNANANNFMHNTWLRRYKTSSTNWQGTALHDGISVDASFLIPGVDTRTWWERRPDERIQLWGSEANIYMSLDQADLSILQGILKVGVASGAPNAAKFNVNVNGGKAIEVFDAVNNKVNFRVNGNGETFARYLRVTASNFPDYVFEDGYEIMSLMEIEAFYKLHRRLPDMPSAAEIERDGLDLAEINKILVKKVEELTIMLVQIEKEVQALKEKTN